MLWTYCIGNAAARGSGNDYESMATRGSGAGPVEGRRRAEDSQEAREISRGRDGAEPDFPAKSFWIEAADLARLDLKQ